MEWSVSITSMELKASATVASKWPFPIKRMPQEIEKMNRLGTKVCVK